MCIRDRYQRRVRGQEERMVKSEGYRCCTRDMFSRPFRARGMPNLSTYLVNFKVGDYVDIKANSAIQQGMPHKTYHGRTGIVWNVTKRAVGVLVNKQVGGRVMAKKIHVRVEHVTPSACRKQFLDLSLIHISEPTRLLSISYAVFCLKKKKKKKNLRGNHLLKKNKTARQKRNKKINKKRNT
eukprot:TRINITY_DN844_c0_g1_i4.p2 TRINITY_DN844_c0_g1~~TRINITY_DN844_c0_g1_i4.p2  ORF type:complete len:182 (-),score=53.76 TRINITY_DN844_c0_g1_i4:30-575(-)